MKKIIGIELGSTRIKAVMINEKGDTVATGIYDWENILTDGLWSYPLELAVEGLRESYRGLADDYKAKTGEELTEIDALGISGMMHGYLAFDSKMNLLAPFRTWRNTNAAEASKELSDLFDFHMPMRWSVSQYYQSVLDGLDHVKNVAHMHTLSSYVHYLLSGRNVVGINDASGMLPISGRDYDSVMVSKFNELMKKKGFEVDIYGILPKVLAAGEDAGRLTEEGARLLDPSGRLRAGCPMCPPEGDMGTGTVATNAVLPGTANVSSGTSSNVSVVLEKPLKGRYEEIDIQNTPAGDPVALIHANNCTSEINEWVSLFGEVLDLFGCSVSKGEIFTKLFKKSLESDKDVGKNVEYNFLAGEPVAGPKEGTLMFMRTPDGKMNLANLMQANIYSALAALSLGTDILKKEDVEIKEVKAHGGFYKTDFVGQSATSAVLGGAPVTVMKNAGEGGAWGVALLALFRLIRKNGGEESLADFLERIFAGAEKTVLAASEEEKAKFASYMVNYKRGLEKHWKE